MTVQPTAELARIESYALRRSSRDLYGRGLIGPIFYVFAYVLLLSVSDYVQRGGWWVVLPALFFAVLGWARWVHKLPPDDAPTEMLARWKKVHWLIIHAGSVTWGLVPALAGWLEGKPDSAILVTSLSTMAFCTAGSQAFAMNPAQARVTILALITPGIVVFLLPGHELRPTGVTLFLYSFYLLANLRRSAKEYAQQVQTEMELLRSRAEVALLSLTDSLTGLFNRRHYDVVWTQAAATAVRAQEPLALLMLDLDHFKRVNDAHGHVAGDACLKHFAGLLKEHFRRESDMVARTGGEEFAVVLPSTTEEKALELSESLRTLLLARPFQLGELALPLTVSVGIAVVEPGNPEPDLAYARADTACYAAKRAGRDRVVAWRPTLES